MINSHEKNIYFLLLIAATFSFAQSSIYRPFPTSGYWIYQYYDEFHNPTYSYNNYFIGGDTSFSGVTYKKIKSSQYSYRGAIRENSKVVYFRPDTGIVEHVLYDFTMVAGTTFTPFGGALCSNTVNIASVDSVMASDGYHKRLNLNSSVSWIEGIGSIFYLLDPAQVACVSGNYFLECMHSNYPYSYPYSICNVFVSELNKEINQIKVFPNPSSGSFSIKLNGGNIKEISLSDMLGRIILKKEVNESSEAKVEVSRAGVFILTVKDNNNRVYTSRIIITE